MSKIKSYQKFNESLLEPINEEFIGALIKGALGKLFGVFTAPFKDIANDFKNMFKENDPNSIKGIILTNFDQAVDAAQKEIPNLKEETAVNDIMSKMIDALVTLANGIDKDVDTAIGKNKSAGPKAIAKAIILGNKDADWAGIVGLLDPNKGSGGIKVQYKYSKLAFDKALMDAATKGGSNPLKARKDAASKFLDGMQADIKSQLDKEFTEEEIKKLYDEVKKKGGEEVPVMNYDKLKDFYTNKTPMIYLLKGKTKDDWDKLTDELKKKPEIARDIVGVKPIDALDDQDLPTSVTFRDKNNQPTIRKGYSDIIGPAGTDQDRSEEQKQAAEALGKIKQDPEKMKKVASFAQFLQDDKNKDKVSEIDKILSTGQPVTKEV